ncbi:uncharacterized protein LOC142340013 [Convolutriloba macropyga]|uniref:uncharacterized protein LOC142340013 n=1 Tax=Convolutriloba macropyga TaxID=536237 RepID=UPI003F526B00
MSSLNGPLYGVSAGACAALAAFFVKLSGYSISISWAAILQSSEKGADFGIYDLFDVIVSGVLVIVHLLPAIVCNILMANFVARGLAFSQSTVVPMATNLASNLLLTGILSLVFFGEEISMWWIVGITLIMTGTVLFNSSNLVTDQDIKHISEKQQ